MLKLSLKPTKNDILLKHIHGTGFTFTVDGSGFLQQALIVEYAELYSPDLSVTTTPSATYKKGVSTAFVFHGANVTDYEACVEFINTNL
ncbi:hypothetical protein [Mucilaginibacter sp. 10B2]|uniref:hypothetical protein n=1 Tax=Mucilaginibacter sp. 10B2 TaxID=3048574 RepID=UPI002B2349A4|nr:hypothetical protein [Mucilaginibacter sp. 10B2]MEB0278973.1 hypothetical protein [Mucilaginibacter sp. 10B2]